MYGISCRPCVDVHKGGGGPAHVDACGQGEVKNVIFFVDVINGWPLINVSATLGRQ